jgi:hypothetical protein
MTAYWFVKTVSVLFLSQHHRTLLRLAFGDVDLSGVACALQADTASAVGVNASDLGGTRTHAKRRMQDVEESAPFLRLVPSIKAGRPNALKASEVRPLCNISAPKFSFHS